jgi:hypothetical protein
MVSQAGGVPAVEQQAEHALLGGDSDVHVCCCRPNVALCGKDLSGYHDADEEEPTDCIRCEVLDEADVPCGAPFCRLRSAWRVLRGRA